MKSFAIISALLGTACLLLAPSRVLSQNKDAPESTLLLKDARLSKAVTMNTGATTTTSVFHAVHRDAAVRLYTEDLELKTARLIVAEEGQSAAALMDAVAALWLARWEKDTANKYKLLVPARESNIYLPKNDFQRERFAAGQRFVGALDTLPANLQTALRSGQQIQASALPPGMLRSIRDMADTLNREKHELRGDTHPFPLDRVPESHVDLEIKNKGTLTTYFVTIGLQDWGSMGWLFTDHEERKRETDRQTGADSAIHDTEKVRLTREQVRQIPALKKLVSVQAKQATLPQILRALHEKYAIPFVCDPARFMTQRADVDIRSMPLGEALDKLTDTYQDTEWEWRKMGFLIVRAPGSPARTRKK